MEPWPGRFELVDPKRIIFHRIEEGGYQRDEKWPLISKIASRPSWPKFGCVLLFEREDGSLVCYDGQQRLNGVLCSVNLPALVPAIIMPHASLAEEAEAFIGVVVDRKQLSAIENHKSSLVAGDAAAHAIQRATDKAGFTISSGSDSARSISCVVTLYWINKYFGEESVTIVLTTTREAWGDDRQALRAAIVRAVAETLADSGKPADKVVAALAKTTPAAILRKADALMFDLGGSKHENIRRAIKALAKV